MGTSTKFQLTDRNDELQNIKNEFSNKFIPGYFVDIDDKNY